MSTRWLSEGGWHNSDWLVGASPKVRETRPAVARGICSAGSWTEVRGWISGGSLLEYQSHHEGGSCREDVRGERLRREHEESTIGIFKWSGCLD